MRSIVNNSKSGSLGVWSSVHQHVSNLSLRQNAVHWIVVFAVHDGNGDGSQTPHTDFQNIASTGRVTLTPGTSIRNVPEEEWDDIFAGKYPVNGGWEIAHFSDAILF